VIIARSIQRSPHWITDEQSHGFDIVLKRKISSSKVFFLFKLKIKTN
jgi:hypothetical protein